MTTTTRRPQVRPHLRHGQGWRRPTAHRSHPAAAHPSHHRRPGTTDSFRRQRNPAQPGPVATVTTHGVMASAWPWLGSKAGRRVARPAGMVRPVDGPFVALAARFLIEAHKRGSALGGPSCWSHRALPVSGRLLDGVRPMVLVPS
jgi:hypothetical protein